MSVRESRKAVILSGGVDLWGRYFARKVDAVVISVYIVVCRNGGGGWEG